MPKSVILSAIIDKFRATQLKKGIPILILFAAATNVILISAKRRTIGTLVTALSSAYNSTTMYELNWIADSYAAVAFFLVPFTTTLLIRNGLPYQSSMFAAGGLILFSCLSSAAVPGPTYLYFTHTVFHGLGSTLVISTCALIVGDYFDSGHRFHIMATALVSDGPLGVLVFGPLYASLVQHFGWRNAFVFIGLIFLAVCWLAAFTFVPNVRIQYGQLPNEDIPTSVIAQELTARNNNGWAFPTWGHIYENHQIVLWIFERLIHYTIVFDLLTNLTNFVSSRMGGKVEHGAEVNLAFGIGESIIFILGVAFGDRIRGFLIFAYLIGSFLALVFMFIIDFLFTTMRPLIILSGFLGFAIGSGNSCLYTTSEEVMLVHGSIAFPFSAMMTGIGMLISPLLSGYVIDKIGYQAYFNCQTGLVAFRFLFLIGINAMMWEHRKKNIEIKKMLQQQIAMTPIDQPSTSKPYLMNDTKSDSEGVEFVE